MPSTEGLARVGHPFIYGVLTFIALINIIISGILVGQQNKYGYYGDVLQTRTRYTLFVSLWTFIFGLFYIVAFLKLTASRIASVASHLLWLIITLILWIAAGAALDTALNKRCHGIPSVPHCNTLRASEGLSWAAVVMEVLAIIMVTCLGVKSGEGFNGSLV